MTATQLVAKRKCVMAIVSFKVTAKGHFMIAGNDGGAMLAGVKVIDLTSVVFGPYTTKILADLGAEVVKVEAQTGDTARYIGKPSVTPGMGPIFMALSRGKTSLALDLKLPENAARLQALIAEADVFILNIRGKAAERLDRKSVV